MTYNQLFILNYEGKILKINSTKQDNYHMRNISPEEEKNHRLLVDLI